MKSVTTVLTTGANRGLGFVLTNKLFSSPIKREIIMTSRDLKAGREAFDKIISNNPSSQSKLYLQQLDLEDEKSINSFAENIKNKYQKIDILVNNAGAGNLEDVMNTSSKVISGPFAEKIMKVNLINTISLTEKLIPTLSDNGKIIMISTIMGKLSTQTPELQRILSDRTLTTDKIIKLAELFIESSKDNSHKKHGFSSSSYCLSKALLNSYVRFVLGKITKPNQQLYAVHPGWCKTDMGGKTAPLTAEQGVETTMFLIDLPYDVNESYQCKLFDRNRVISF